MIELPKGALLSFKELDDHISELCSDLGIKREITEGRGHAKVKRRIIRHQPIVDDTMAYFVALHEIGHVVVGLQRSRLEREAKAWKWALANSIIEAHYSIRQRICALLWRYVMRAMSNDWPLPDPASDYWRLMAWWDRGETLALVTTSDQHDADKKAG